MFAQTGRPTRTAAAPLCLIVMSVVLSALTGAEAFDLSGVATGFSPAPLGDRYFAQPLQAGAGSAPTAWTVTCVSLNCGWSTVTLRLTGGAGVSFRAEGVINAMTGTIHTNPTTGETVVEWSNDTTWVWFKGAASGLWTSWASGQPKVGDALVLAHNVSAGSITARCLADYGPCSWDSGAGSGPGTGVSCGGALDMQLQPSGTKLSGSIASNCSLIDWSSSGSLWGRLQPQQLPKTVRKVHVVFMNHLDVGYDGIEWKYPDLPGFINNVLNIYSFDYFPLAMKIADDMRALGGTDRFIYTTHPFLVSIYLDCPQFLTLAGNVTLRCPSAGEIANFTAAMQRGDIVMHAGPFNLQPENMSPQLFRDSLRLAPALAKRLGVPVPTTLSQRDVPFMSRGVIPILNDAGVQAITVGTNGACAFPNVPKAFVWRDLVSNTSVLALEHPRGYGGITRKDCAETTTGVALCYAFRTDNTGPPTSTDEVEKDLDTIRAEYPEASVFASTYDAFVEDLQDARSTLPVYTAEVGDTWMYGVPSDPRKMAENRAITRARDACIGRGDCDPTSAEMANSTRFLIKPPEHTWGLPGTGDGTNWSNEMFQKVRHTSAFFNNTEAWIEQRKFNDLAIEALAVAGHPLAPEAAAAVEGTRPRVPTDPASAGYQSEPALDKPLTLTPKSAGGAPISLTFDGVHGGIVGLSAASAGDAPLQWADADSPLALLAYLTYNDTDFMAMASKYMLSGKCNGSFCKPGSNNYTASAVHMATQTALWVRDDSAIAELQLPSEAHEFAGAPSTAYLNVTAVAGTDGAATLDIELSWANKTATRLGEALMLTFRPAPSAATSTKAGGSELPGAWAMDKLGTLISPMEVMEGGSQYQHGVHTGVYFTSSAGSVLQILTVDAPLVSPMTTAFPWGNPLPYPMDPITTDPFGFAVNLVNNIWTTNYPEWYPFADGVGDEDATFRLSLVL